MRPIPIFKFKDHANGPDGKELNSMKSAYLWLHNKAGFMNQFLWQRVWVIKEIIETRLQSQIDAGENVLILSDASSTHKWDYIDKDGPYKWTPEQKAHITLIGIPANMTTLCQPNDMSINHCLQTSYKQYLIDWYNEYNYKLPRNLAFKFVIRFAD